MIMHTRNTNIPIHCRTHSQWCNPFTDGLVSYIISQIFLLGEDTEQEEVGDKGAAGATTCGMAAMVLSLNAALFAYWTFLLRLSLVEKWKINFFEWSLEQLSIVQSSFIIKVCCIHFRANQICDLWFLKWIK